MSFSSNVKAELLTCILSNKQIHCKKAQLLAIINCCGYVSIAPLHKFVVIHNENLDILNLCKNLIWDFFQYTVDISLNELLIEDSAVVDKIVSTLSLRDSDDFSINPPIAKEIVSSQCCKRMYIRTAFYISGSINDPSKRYHIEFVDNDYDHANALVDMISDFNITMKVIERQNHFVIYCKESEQIVDLLNVMSAYKSLLEFENLRVVKEVRNNVNRRVNCETANINKVVNSAVRQLEDINIVDSSLGIENLPDNLREVAIARRQYPEASLKELGELMIPCVGKSGVNHRLKKIQQLANKFKGDK